MESFSSTSYSKWDDDRAWSSKVENWYWDVRAIGATRWNFLESDTINSTWFLSRGNPSWWNRAIRCEWGNTSWQTGATQYLFSRSGMASTIRHWKRWSRNKIVSGIKIYRESGQKRISNVAEDGEKHCMIWGMFMIVTMESAVFMEKNYLNTCQSIVNTADLTLKQMFDVSARLVSEQDEISGLETIGWENYSWKYLSLIGDERIINLQRTKVYVFPDSVLFLGKIFENPESNDACERRSEWIKSFQKLQKLWQYRRWADGIRVEYFPRIQYLAAQWRSQKFTVQIGRYTRKITGRILFMSMFNEIPCGTKDNEKECLGHARVVSLYARKFGKGQWSFIGLGVPYHWRHSPRNLWQYCRKDAVGIRWADVQFSVPRLLCPEVNSKAKALEIVDTLLCRFGYG